MVGQKMDGGNTSFIADGTGSHVDIQIRTGKSGPVMVIQGRAGVEVSQDLSKQLEQMGIQNTYNASDQYPDHRGEIVIPGNQRLTQALLGRGDAATREGVIQDADLALLERGAKTSDQPERVFNIVVETLRNRHEITSQHADALRDNKNGIRDAVERAQLAQPSASGQGKGAVR